MGHGLIMLFGICNLVDKIKTIKLVCVASEDVAHRNKSKDWLAWNQDVFEWSNMSTSGLLVQ